MVWLNPLRRQASPSLLPLRTHGSHAARASAQLGPQPAVPREFELQLSKEPRTVPHQGVSHTAIWVLRVPRRTAPIQMGGAGNGPRPTARQNFPPTGGRHTARYSRPAHPRTRPRTPSQGRHTGPRERSTTTGRFHQPTYPMGAANKRIHRHHHHHHPWSVPCAERSANGYLPHTTRQGAGLVAIRIQSLPMSPVYCTTLQRSLLASR